MPPLAGTGSQLMCAMGAAPSALTIAPGPPHVLMAPTGVPVATINDHLPIANVPSFGMCVSPANPAVQAAEGPAPCVPIIPAPWAPPTGVLIDGVPAIGIGATCMCQWAGTITVLAAPVTTVVTVP
ncbi:MAG TPA: DUF4280 domain-containing protein [Solirubrobacteraceae bacterium]|nr:DUF4280 domain-containing protein [Solirubrobacteraceae bacterium]